MLAIMAAALFAVTLFTFCAINHRPDCHDADGQPMVRTMTPKISQSADFPGDGNANGFISQSRWTQRCRVNFHVQSLHAITQRHGG